MVKVIQKRKEGVIVATYYICLTAICFLATILLKILLVRYLRIDQPLLICALSLVQATILYALFYSSLFADRITVSRTEFFHPFCTLHNASENQNCNNAKVAAAKPESHTYNKFTDELARILITEKGYLDPELTIDKLSEDMHTNRTYISKIVNNNFHVSFREFLNNLRIEHAKQLLEENPETTIESIALNSGFLTASQFNRKFKESEGLSPRLWQATNNLHSAQGAGSEQPDEISD